MFVIQDSGGDPRFADNPLTTGDPHVKFYAGAPLVLRPGFRLGTLCVIDHKARPISVEQRRALQAPARQMADQMELRLKVQELERLDHVKDEFLSMVSHELRTPLTSINGLLSLLHHQTAGVLPGAAHNLVDIAFRNTERLLLIINDILDIAKLEAASWSCIGIRLISARSSNAPLESTGSTVRNAMAALDSATRHPTCQ